MKRAIVFFFSFWASVAMAQNTVVNTLKTETSRTIKKEADTTTWKVKRGGLINLSLSQGSLSNWAAGGDNFSLAASGYFNYFRYYRDSKQFWDNNLDVNLGYIQTTSLGSRKNDDRFDFLSKYGYKIDSANKWFISGLFNFRTQLFDGFTYPKSDSAVLASTFLSPAYVILSLGLDYKPDDKFSVFLSPITSRSTIVTSQELSKKGAYGVDSGKHIISQLGAYATITYNNTFNKIITYKGRLDLFSNYQNNPQNIVFYMINFVGLKINKFLAATYSLDLIYDDNIRIFGSQGKSPALQAKSMIGFSYLRPLITIKKGVMIQPAKKM